MAHVTVIMCHVPELSHDCQMPKFKDEIVEAWKRSKIS